LLEILRPKAFKRPFETVWKLASGPILAFTAGIVEENASRAAFESLLILNAGLSFF